MKDMNLFDSVEVSDDSKRQQYYVIVNSKDDTKAIQCISPVYGDHTILFNSTEGAEEFVKLAKLTIGTYEIKLEELPVDDNFVWELNKENIKELLRL